MLTGLIPNGSIGQLSFVLVTQVRKWAQRMKSLAYNHTANEQEDRQDLSPGLNESREHFVSLLLLGINSRIIMILNNGRSSKHY